jgi:hypothetical protein
MSLLFFYGTMGAIFIFLGVLLLATVFNRRKARRKLKISKEAFKK